MAAGSPEDLGSGDEAVGGSSIVEASDVALEKSPSLPPELQGEYVQASTIHSEASDSFSSSQTSLPTTRTKDSGFSESISSTSCCSLDPQGEKETSCEKTVRPEGKNKEETISLVLHFRLIFIRNTGFVLWFPPTAAVTGYQQPSETTSRHACQFYIGLLDSNNKEQRLDEKGTRRIHLLC